jgi:hypothetical protein
MANEVTIDGVRYVPAPDEHESILDRVELAVQRELVSLFWGEVNTPKELEEILADNKIRVNITDAPELHNIHNPTIETVARAVMGRIQG